MAVRYWMNLSAIQDGLLLLLVLGSACAIGGVHVISSVILSGLAVAFTMIAVLRKPANRHTLPPPFLFWALVVAGLWAVIQCLPLGGLVDVLPGSMGDSWAIAGVGPHRLSGNYPGTLLMANRCLAAAVLLFGTFRFFARPEQVNRLIILIIGSGVVITALALVQEWFGADTLLFLYEPRMGPVRSGLRGPFVNPDHFGAYVALCALLALGRSLTLVFHRIRYVYHGLFIFLSMGLMLSVSLSGCVGFGVGVIALAIIWRAHSRRFGEVAGIAFPLIGLALSLVSVRIWVRCQICCSRTAPGLDPNGRNMDTKRESRAFARPGRDR